MKPIIPITIIAVGAAALAIGLILHSRSKVSTIIDDESVEDFLPKFAGEVDSFKAKGGTVIEIFSIKHGSLAIRAAGKWIYVDPVTKGAKPETDYSVLPKADYILISHEHGDHLDVDALSQLSSPGTMIFANNASVEKASAAVPETEVLGMTNGDGITTAEGWNIEAVPAYNISEGRQNFHPQGNGNGYLLTIDGFRIYIAGDTEDIPELAELNDIDVAFLPCNLPFTMTPEQCAAAARTFMPKVLFPYHYGETDVQQVVTLLSDTSVNVRIRSYK